MKLARQVGASLTVVTKDSSQKAKNQEAAGTYL